MFTIIYCKIRYQKKQINGTLKQTKPERPKTKEMRCVMDSEDIMLLQCQNCGGGIVMKSAQNGVCKHCKSEYFFDTNFSNQVTSMLNEANKDRRIADYDRAISGYQEVIKIDSSNAEAYYGLFISEYGIRFVEENGTFVPTCDRYSSQSVFNNENFQNAIKYAVSNKLKQMFMK